MSGFADEGGNHQYVVSTKSFVFKVRKDGEISLYTNNSEPLKELMGERDYLIFRAAVLHKIAALTVSQYRVPELREIIKKILPPGFNPNRRHNIQRLPRARDLFAASVEIPNDSDPVQARDEEDGQQPDSGQQCDSSRQPCPHWAPDHKRLLAEGFFPSFRNYRESFGKQPLRAFIIDPLQKKIVGTPVVNDEPAYNDFILLAKILVQSEKEKGNLVRFETTVKGHENRVARPFSQETRITTDSVFRQSGKDEVRSVEDAKRVIHEQAERLGITIKELLNPEKISQYIRSNPAIKEALKFLK